ncbi:helix-turn-helix transcriptional regulator [Streptomyces sp. LX-29]|uniref:helix-turn-helix transcriptional regulator n=1 Tax=Streptomyces sp. LX-29 TaxID=2900152 RepID=UPI00240E385D|nr:helix-turn-helix transcriptional regulator [Streptomyces sp. LX-29]WFB10742.1 helix-turn-helix transcriptional regulator [Streptomyces sp. LX-29]
MVSITVDSRPLPGAVELAEATRRFLAEGTGEVFCYWNYTSSEDPLLDVLRGAGSRLWDREGGVRTVLPHGTRGVPDIAEHVAWQQDHGVQVRYSSRLPPGAMVLTEGGAILTTGLQPDSTYVLVTDPHVRPAFGALAQLLWQRAEIPPDQRKDAPSEAERQMLRMLMQGLTDSAVARQLGMSDRTVRRVVAQLMERLGAQSRFEAGVRAVERGWI